MAYIAAALVIANVLVWVSRLLLDASKGYAVSFEAISAEPNLRRPSETGYRLVRERGAA